MAETTTPNNGWIKLYRELTDKPIWGRSSPEHKVILITLLMMANHAHNEWEWKGKRFICEPGQMITSLDQIAKTAGKGISVQNIRTALDRFERYNFLTNESTKTGRLITICNWATYQQNENTTNKDANKELTKSQQRANKELTSNKNDKNDKNENKERETRTQQPKSTNPDYIKFNNWIQEKAPYCSNPRNFPHQITEEEFIKLKKKYSGQQIADIVEKIENRKDLRKRYSNLYLTVNNWIKKEIENG